MANMPKTGLKKLMKRAKKEQKDDMYSLFSSTEYDLVRLSKLVDLLNDYIIKISDITNINLDTMPRVYGVIYAIFLMLAPLMKEEEYKESRRLLINLFNNIYNVDNYNEANKKLQLLKDTYLISEFLMYIKQDRNLGFKITKHSEVAEKDFLTNELV